MVSGADQIDNSQKQINELYRSITGQNVSGLVKCDVMQRAVATCLKVDMDVEGKGIPSLLDLGSQVTLRGRSCPTLCHQAGKMLKFFRLFHLAVANNGRLPVYIYIKLDLDFLGIMVPKFGALVPQEPNEPLDKCHKTKLPGIISWNLIKLAYEVFKQKY